jgi:hypothetical protein
MTPERLEECLRNLKSKNCEGSYRLLLRIMKDGATVLGKPWSVLFHKIYERKEIPEEWKVSKGLPYIKRVRKRILKTTDQSQTFAQLPKSLKD